MIKYRTELTPAEEGTKIHWGKPYHWELHDGVLHLVHGEAPDTVVEGDG